MNNETMTHIWNELALPLGVLAASVSLSFFFISAAPHLSMSRGALSFFNALTYLPLLVLVAGILVCWHFNNTGLVLTSVALSVMYLAFQAYGAPVFGQPSLGSAVNKASLFLFPVNLVAFSLLIKRRIFSTLGSLYLFAFGLEVLAVMIFCNPQGVFFSEFQSVLAVYSEGVAGSAVQGARHLTRFLNSITRLPCLLVLLWTLVFLFVRYIYKRDIGLAGFSMIFAAAMAGLLTGTSPASACVFFLASGILVIVSSLESSFAMVDQDPLTGLGARKSLSGLLQSLGGSYVLALVDLDHFSRFNDDFGPGSGDEALKIVGDKLADMIPGVRAFRYGGEEFLVVIPDRKGPEAEHLLETFRRKIEAFPFLSGQDQGPASGYTPGKKHRPVIRKTHLTVSVGAASFMGQGKAQDVLKNADKALNQAKRLGRNRVVLWVGDQ